MWYTGVLPTIVLCSHLTLVWGTDLSVVYKHNIYHLKHADTSSPPPPRPLLAAPLHFPVGLTYVGTHASSGNKSLLLLVTDTSSGQASVFGLKLGANHQDAVVEQVIKRSSTSRDLLAYDHVNRALYLSWPSSSQQSACLGVSQLPEDLASKWAPQPTLLTRVGKGMVVRGLAIDPCNRVLYWSEGDGLYASAVRRSPLDGGGEVDTLLQAAPGTHYQGIHYDPHSQSLLVAVTNSSNSSLSSCSFLSMTPLGRPDQTATRSSSSKLPPGGVAAGLKVETLATPLDECFPYAVTADERFLYYSDWARQGLMRLDRRAVGGNATRLVVTPGVQSQVGWHPGALGLAIIPGEDKEVGGEACTGTGKDFLGIRDSLNHVTSTVDSFDAKVVAALKHEQYSKSEEENYATNEDEDYVYVDINNAVVTASTTKISETAENTDVKPATMIEKNKNEDLLRKGASSGVEDAALPSMTNEFRHALLDVRSSTVATTQSEGTVAVEGRNDPATVVSDNVRVSVHSHSSETYDFTLIGSLSQLSHGQLEKAVVCLSAVCCLFFITSLLLILKLRTLRRHPAGGIGYSPADGTATNPHTAFQCEGRGYQDAAPSYDTQRNTGSGMCNGTAGVIGSTDVIIDLSSQDLKYGDALTSSPSVGAGAAARCLLPNQYSKKRLAGKPKKRFGPSKGGIKHLISKSFLGGSSAGGGGSYCPGLKRADDDGVLLNIEDCCQMTLCDTPCYSSVQKEGKKYQGGRGGDGDKQGLLDDDNFVPNTDC